MPTVFVSTSSIYGKLFSMKKSLAAIVALSALFSVHAQEAFQAPLVQKSLLLDIDSSDYVIAVGERGHILTSADGVSFTQQQVPTTATLTAVKVINDDAWAVGHDATILHSADKGKTWQVQMSAPDLEKPFLDVLFFDNKQGIAVGAYGLFYRTEDGGEHWSRELHATLLNPADQEYLDEVKRETPEYYEEELRAILPHLNKMRNVNGTLYMVGEAGLVAKSNNKGKTWTRMDTGYEGSFLDVKAVNDLTMMIVGLRGNTFVSQDDGEWQYVATCMSGSLNTILPASEDHVYMLGNNGMMVTLPLPAQTSEYDPYAPRSECEPVSGFAQTQIKDKASIVNVTQFNGHTIAVTANGIKQLDLE